MVSLDDVLVSNAQIPRVLPKRLVAVFAGGTSGIGEATLKALVKYAVEPKIYLFARNPASAERVIAECRQLNPEGGYEFVKVDLSSMQQTDDACEAVKRREKLLNLVFLSAMEITFDRQLTAEGHNNALAASTYARFRIVQNLLPLLSAAGRTSPLARVVNVKFDTTEGYIDTTDLATWNVPFYRLRPHISTMHTLALESLAQQEKNISFVHQFPGAVYTSSHKNVPGFRGWLFFLVLELVHFLFGRWLFIPNDECGERYLFSATSARYPPLDGEAKGVPQGEAVGMKGTNGRVHSGVYSVGWGGEGPMESAVVALKELREIGVREVVWQHLIEQWKKAGCDTVS